MNIHVQVVGDLVVQAVKVCWRWHVVETLSNVLSEGAVLIVDKSVCDLEDVSVLLERDVDNEAI